MNWNTLLTWLQSGQLPIYTYTQLGTVLQPYIRDEDILVSTHLLIWTFPNHPNLVSVTGELTAMREWELSNGIQVWERVQPTVIVDIPNQMTIPSALQTYMQTHQFALCQHLAVQNFQVDVYRPTCTEIT